jgi:hypothetical protein
MSRTGLLAFDLEEPTTEAIFTKAVDENAYQGMPLMRAAVEANLEDPCAKQDFLLMLRQKDYEIVLQEIAEKIFRPHRRHGYTNPLLNQLLQDPAAHQVTGMLEDMFYEILEKRDLELYP